MQQDDATHPTLLEFSEVLRELTAKAVDRMAEDFIKSERSLNNVLHEDNPQPENRRGE